METEYIRDYPSQLIIGSIETDSKGNQTARVWPSRRIVGYYKADQDYTTDFYGRRISKGNSVVNLIYQEKNK